MPITAGLERTGKLVRCTYFSQSRQGASPTQVQAALLVAGESGTSEAGR